ncbi:hypothetical protein [Rhizobium wenxiniae]|uniref:hypothetical protein n=1 Tax=Rhizobium wenxiniae TaxID=1737357 RepID=UPI003C17ECCD
MTGTFINPLARGGPGIIGKARDMKAWVREILSLDDSVVVSINETSCTLPGCPPRETVILVMFGDTTHQISIHQAMADIDKDQVLVACASTTAVAALTSARPNIIHGDVVVKHKP